MKKILSLFLVVILCFSTAVITTAQTQPALGDVNGDGAITPGDALLILKHTVEREVLTGPGLAAADTTGKKIPGSEDALNILQKVVGKLRHFPVEKTVQDNTIAYLWRIDIDVETNGLISNAYLCRTYQEYTEYLENGAIDTTYADHYGLVEEIEKYRSYYSEEFFETKSLLFFLPSRGYNHTEIAIQQCYTADKELNLLVSNRTCFHDGLGYPAVVPPKKIYVLEIASPLEEIESLHFQLNYEQMKTKIDGTIRENISRRLEYDFPVS